jgi:hypothetical protein
MTKKTLEEKIKHVLVWAFILSIVYFAIGAYLKSDGPKFDPSKTYELLKDTLTLTAAFLAPVAAFVLFSDWRNEHVEKKLDSIADKLLIDINDIELILWHSHYKPAISVIGHDVSLIKHHTKGSLFDMRKALANDMNIIKGLSSFTPLIASQLSDFINTTHKIEDKIKLLKFDENRPDTEKIPTDVRLTYMIEVTRGLEKISSLKSQLFESLSDMKIKSK